MWTPVSPLHSSSQFLIKSFLLRVECTEFLLRVPEVLVSELTSIVHLTEKGPFLHYNAISRIYLRYCGKSYEAIRYTLQY